MTETFQDLSLRLLFEVTEAVLNLASDGVVHRGMAQEIYDTRKKIVESGGLPPHSHQRLLREVLHTARTAGLSVDGMSMALGRICDLVEPYTLTPHYEPSDEDGRLPEIRRVLAEADPIAVVPHNINVFRDVIKRASAIANARVG